MRCFQVFRVSSPSGNGASYEPPPLPSEISAFEPPSPSEFPVTFRGGVWIFSGTTQFNGGTLTVFTHVMCSPYVVLSQVILAM